MTRDRRRRRRWNCLFELDEQTKEICPSWGFADIGEEAGDLQHKHFLAQHYQPPSEDDHDD